MPALDARVRLWTVALLVASGTSGLALLRAFLDRAESLPPAWRSLAVWGVGATTAAGTLLLLALVLFWRRLEERHLVAAVVALGVLLVLGPATAKTAGRLALGPGHMVLDSVLQVEVASGMLVQGRNPYRETYYGTDLETWHGGRDRFPLRHLVYPPVPLLLTAPVRAACIGLFGAYDSRFLLIPAWIAAFAICLKAWRGLPWRALLLAVAFLNPLILPNLHVGRWDTLALLVWVLGLTAWARERPAAWAVALGILAGIKTVFLAAGVFGALAVVRNARDARRWGAAWAGAFVLPLLPFVVWDAPALWEDLVAAPLALGGRPSILVDAGPYGGAWIARLLGGVAPAWILQIPVTLGVAAMAGREVFERRSAAAVGAALGVTLATFFYFGSYADAAYVGYLLSMAAAGFGFDVPRRGGAGAA
jgi:hypothetical protein